MSAFTEGQIIRWKRGYYRVVRYGCATGSAICRWKDHEPITVNVLYPDGTKKHDGTVCLPGDECTPEEVT